MNYDKLHKKKQELDSYRPLPEALVKNLDAWYQIELTYTSNAIEGNTLSRQETALVVEKGLTVGGKTLNEHLEAINHSKALSWVKGMINANAITEADILHLHYLILHGIDDTNAGHYRNVAVRISGSNVILPNPRKVPDLMADFIKWIACAEIDVIELAALAHYELVTIHPFTDGNGRTARLLMNLILNMNGFPSAIISPQDRLAYIQSLEKAQLGGEKTDYLKLIAKAVGRSLDLYLKAVKGDDEPQPKTTTFLKIGELAAAVKETVATIRFWTKEGLLDVANTTASGYQLYGPSMIDRIAKINELKQRRFTLSEIKTKIAYRSKS